MNQTFWYLPKSNLILEKISVSGDIVLCQVVKSPWNPVGQVFIFDAWFCDEFFSKATDEDFMKCEKVIPRSLIEKGF